MERISFEELLAEIDNLLQVTSDYLESNGKRYNLSEWVTPKRYAEIYRLDNPSVVSNWMKRGIIPPEDVVSIDMLNGLKLIRLRPVKFLK